MSTAASAGTWVVNRFKEASTWTGGAIVAVGSANFPTTGIDKVDHYTPMVQHLCQFVGVALACMSTKHP